jgi:hypothetical protein
LHSIDPGKPTQNAYIETSTASSGTSVLDQNWFDDLGDARKKIEAWSLEYNTVRPHSSLGYATPQEFAERFITDNRRPDSHSSWLKTGAGQYSILIRRIYCSKFAKKIRPYQILFSSVA